ncbi:MAG: helix-turn-helix domain-containing protein [Armatimonadota bacterium]
MANTTFGDRLRELRNRAGRSQEDVATAAQISPVTLSRLENDEIRHPWASTVHRLAKALGIGVEDLLGDGTREA